MEVARELAGHVRDWLEAAERVLGSGQAELALAGGRDGRAPKPDLATRLKEAWEARQVRHEPELPTPEREAPEDLAARLREAAAGIDRDTLAGRAATLQQAREAEEQQRAHQRHSGSGHSL